MRRINIMLVLVALFIIGMFIFAACDKAEPKVSEAESEARLKVAESQRESEMRTVETTFETTVETTTEITVETTFPAYETYIESETYIEPYEVEDDTEVFEESYSEEETEEEVYTTTVQGVTEETLTEEETSKVIDDWGFDYDELYEIARITYLENGCEGYYYPTYLTACVILNRYLDWDYDSIYDVIHAPGQYSTADKYTNWSGGELVISDMTWQAVFDAMNDLDRNPHYQMRGGSGNLYYRHPETGECFYY